MTVAKLFTDLNIKEKHKRIQYRHIYVPYLFTEMVYVCIALAQTRPLVECHVLYDVIITIIP